MTKSKAQQYAEAIQVKPVFRSKDGFPIAEVTSCGLCDLEPFKLRPETALELAKWIIDTFDTRED